jgi:O-antigen/teichoic acid export membrane protein
MIRRRAQKGTEPAAAVGAATSGAVGGSILLRRILTYAPGSLVPAALGLVTSMVFTRIFSPAAFGKYSLFLFVASPVTIVFTSWLKLSIGKFLPAEHTAEGRRQTKDAIFLTTVLIFVGETVIGVGAFFVANSLLSPGWQPFLLPVLLFILVTSIFEALLVVFTAESRAKEYVSYRLFDSIATFALRLILVSGIFSMDIRLMFWSVVLSNGVLLPLMWVRAGFPAPTRFAHTLRSRQVRGVALAFVTFGVPMTLWLFSSLLLDVGDRYVLNYLLGPGAVGIYDANYRLIAGVTPLLVVPIAVTLHPYLISISGSGDEERIGQVIGTVVQKLVLVGLLCVGLLFLLHSDVARILLGPKFREGSIVMVPVLVGVFLFNIGTFAHKPFEIVGRTRVMVVIAIVAAAANIAFCFALIPWVGYVGAAYATLLSYLLYTVGVGALGRRIISWHIDRRTMVTNGGLICGGVAAIYLLRGAASGLPYAWSLTMTALACCALASVSLLRLLRRGSP